MMPLGTESEYLPPEAVQCNLRGDQNSWMLKVSPSLSLTWLKQCNGFDTEEITKAVRWLPGRIPLNKRKLLTKLLDFSLEPKDPSYGCRPQPKHVSPPPPSCFVCSPFSLHPRLIPLWYQGRILGDIMLNPPVPGKSYLWGHYTAHRSVLLGMHMREVKWGVIKTTGSRGLIPYT